MSRQLWRGGQPIRHCFGWCSWKVDRRPSASMALQSTPGCE
jgi:hypothetical protein